MNSINNELLKIVYSLDELKGKGKFVDAYFGDIGVEKKSLYDTQTSISKAVSSLLDYLEKHEKDNHIGKFHMLQDIKKNLNLLSYNNQIDYIKIIEDLYDVSCEMPPEDEIQFLKNEIHNKLYSLGFSGNWNEMVNSWDKSALVSGEEYMNLLSKELDRGKKLSFDKIGIHIFNQLQGEELKNKSKITLDLVDTNEKWSAYNYYLGNYTSNIAVNSKITFNKYGVFQFAFHEGFPGHHFDEMIKECFYRNGDLGMESTLLLLNTSQSILAEGLANYGYKFFDLQLTNNEQIFDLLGRLKIAIRHKYGCLYLSNKITEKECMKELCAVYGEDSKRTFDFINEWKYYFPVYYTGEKLINNLHKIFGTDLYKPLYMSRGIWDLKQKLDIDDLKKN